MLLTGTLRGLAVAGALILTSAGTTGRAGAQSRPCDDFPPERGPSRDLYCIDLVPAPGFDQLRGRVELSHIPGPFTVAVTRDGHLRYRPVVHLDPLPPPGSLGPYTRFVAWALTPEMDRVVRLGAVTGGSHVLADIDLEKFFFFITPEADTESTEPTGPAVLRAQSPSTRLQPPDFLEFALGSMVEPGAPGRHPPATDSTADPHAQHSPAVAQGATGTWPHHPMHPSVQMLPAEMALVPAVAPYLPNAPDPSAVPFARPTELVRLASGDTLELEAGLVRRSYKGEPYLMFGFNGQQTGPLLQVEQGAEVVVVFHNALDQPSAIHWHGIRLDNRFDGVPGMTQDPVPPGGSFTYHLRFPDAGIYWYHPHVREDIQQDLGLYGNLMVRPEREDFHGPAHREEVLLLDDLLVGDDGLMPWGAAGTTHALMGRFGNLFLVNGEPDWSTTVQRGEVVRFFLTNVSNTRTFNLSFGSGARIKVVGSDVGNFEHEEWVESVVLAPAERYVVHVRFDSPGPAPLVNRVRGLDHLFGRFFQEVDTLGTVQVLTGTATPEISAAFDTLRHDSHMSREVDGFREHFERAADRELALRLRTRNLPFITQALMQLDSIYFAPVEWSGTMPHMNWASTADQVTWVVQDPRTGRENMEIDDWRFRVGDVVKVRISNERASFHAMHHPIHIHGQRFLVLDVNGVRRENLVWKDTVLLPVGTTMNLLVEMSNPGRWMLHCHIAEHLSASMMMEFQVEGEVEGLGGGGNP